MAALKQLEVCAPAVLDELVARCRWVPGHRAAAANICTRAYIPVLAYGRQAECSRAEEAEAAVILQSSWRGKALRMELQRVT
jgi:hypothetical protein